jgi:hypothetical protein
MGVFLLCTYIYCKSQPMQARRFCPRINLRCFNCMCRGHAEEDKVCENVNVNLALFEDTARLGWVTCNRFQQEGCTLGFYPILTLSQVRHLDNIDGYSRLLALSIPDVQQLVTEGICS